MTRRVRRQSLALVAAAAIAGCSESEGNFAGMSREGAAEIARTRVARIQQSSTVTRSEEVKAQTPSGKDAWLVRVIFDGESGNVCVYVWRDKRVRLRMDGTCRHWDFRR
jgi:hypothetical protein